ncbi:hypothetical protein P3T76_007661 [Phytophthora citrophthora]|uniref:Jacalin-type lectin domain-containing protein n=1 Tax=Phytophthora citrophthora TaxID=4793 RepID=A0AAD9LLG6_9STRA|nr:hypothetical protein P3T76_007661 [Phytophthora citrophthora]
MNTLQLGPGEYITSMEVHSSKNKQTKDHTRVFYLKFVTNAGNSVSGGSQAGSIGSATAPTGYHLAGFYGRDGGQIDLLGAIWAPLPTEVGPGTVAPANIPEPETPASSVLAVFDHSASMGSGSAASDDTIVFPVSTRIILPATTTAPTPSGPATQLSEAYGGPHGSLFSDVALAMAGQTISSIAIRAGARIDGITLTVAAPTALSFVHGYDGVSNTNNALSLGVGEYITSMEVHSAKNRHTNDHTRVFYLKFTTNAGRSVFAGTQTDSSAVATAPEGYQLGGFFGRGDREIVLLGAVWTRIAADLPSTDEGTARSGDIQLSPIYGGPHGTAFSDIASIKLSRPVSTITICAGARVDGILLQSGDQTFSHGYSCAQGNTLVLGEGEYITSLEAHWGKNRRTNDHTRVFYLKFITSAGNSVSGGTTTSDTAVATAPKGFQLSGFFGRAGGVIDQLGAIWTRRSATDLSLTDEMESSGMYATTIRNWVGPTIGQSSDTACYRKSVAFGSKNVCPLGYSNDGDDCLAMCPLSYPVECSLECIPQNDDCALATLTKIGSVVAVALNLASGGVFGGILAAYKTAKLAVTCAANIVSVVRGLIYYLRYRQTTAPQGKAAELLTVAYQTDVVLYDLPVAVCVCLGLPVPQNAKFAATVLVIVEGIVKQAITNGDEIISTGENVLNLLTGTGALNGTVDSSTTDELQDLITRNSSCGYELKRLTDHVVRSVNDIRSSGASAADVRVQVYKSSIVTNDIPAVTNHCMGELLGSKTLTGAYETRDMLRKTFGVIVDQLIDTGTTDMGKNVAQDEYMLKVANMGLVVLSTVDPTGIAYMASQFVQPICGPTAYLGDIDDGTLHDALGLTTVDEAFVGSYGTWARKGDGIVHLVFESIDKEDVTVVIHSGGDEYANVDVAAGATVIWDATIPELQDKSLYLDRWRPGVFGLPGSGGGSLLLWIPRSTEGGHLEMHVRVNVS